MFNSFTFPRVADFNIMNWWQSTKAVVPKCCIVARLKIVDKDFWLDGAVLELTTHHALFREASTYILRRHDEEVFLEIEGMEWHARLASTNPQGYQIEFFEPLPADLVRGVCDRWRV